ncbi:hypothetical protein R3W88_031904 [Solanum pinnatisectum]|uniref:Uncharacterized protein n=1 Tax=Solanum pinnatisectum TaxID=50273 RepID=A0AAV9LRI7_9SOLN|nr:hypothetical protein R3W88_031904 [Solanum pinnatisectum]
MGFGPIKQNTKLEIFGAFGPIFADAYNVYSHRIPLYTSCISCEFNVYSMYTGRISTSLPPVVQLTFQLCWIEEVGSNLNSRICKQESPKWTRMERVHAQEEIKIISN